MLFEKHCMLPHTVLSVLYIHCMLPHTVLSVLYIHCMLPHTALFVLYIHCAVIHTVLCIHTFYAVMGIQTQWAVPVLMDAILVMMNQVDLTRPTCISLIISTSEVYTLPCQFFVPPKGLWYTDWYSLIISNFMLVDSGYWNFFIKSKSQIHSLQLTTWYFLFQH